MTLQSHTQAHVLRSGSRAPLRVLVALGAAALFGLGACGDNPFEIRWAAAPDTVLLYSLSRPELNLPSAININRRILVRVEAPGASGSWDLAVDSDGENFFFLPPGALGVVSRAGITKIGPVDFLEVTEAPRDTIVYSVRTPLLAELGNIYVIRTDESTGAFGLRCVYFGKLEPIEIDVENGTIDFVYDSNPVCNDLSLIPPN